MDDQNQKPTATAVHNDLNPDQAVSLRPATPYQPSQPPAATSNSQPKTIDKPSAYINASPANVAQPERATATLLPTSSPTPEPLTATAETAPDTPFQVAQPGATSPNGSVEVSWTASEFIAHPKSMNWYLALAGISLVVVVLAYLIHHDIVTVIVIIISACLFGYSAGRQPRQLQYTLDQSSIQIGGKAYPYKDFSSFAVIAEGPFSSIDFMPLKRFAPILSIYYDPSQEPHVMEILNQHLPLANHKRTVIDNLMHRIRF